MLKRDYHEYVFREGRLIGAFDDMYKNAASVPWHQDRINEQWNRQFIFNQLKSHAPYENILVVGCGLGYLADHLFKHQLSKSITGMDLSRHAIETARKNFPHITFLQGDIREKGLFLKECSGKYDLVVMVSVLWYVFDCIENVIENLVQASGSYLYIYQDYYYETEQFVGKEKIPSHEKFIELFGGRIVLVNSILAKAYEEFKNGYYFSFLARKAVKTI